MKVIITLMGLHLPKIFPGFIQLRIPVFHFLRVLPTRQPSDTITVVDNNLNSNRPIRNATVVTRRFLKVERPYTNNQGQYFINKEFRKVTLPVKFKNGQAKIRALSRTRLWQMLFSVKTKMGQYKGSLMTSFIILFTTVAL
jgi:hypothetical protein